MKLLNPDGRSNLHTHTCFCDGKDRPEDLVKQALALGFSTLGFSGHEYSEHDVDFCMSQEETRHYRSEILQLKEKYRNRIRILLGVERDYFGCGDDYPYDYIIGSLHYAKAPDGFLLSVDNTEEVMEKGVREHFDGDYRAYVESYYETIADVVEKTGADIVGHFDLITKFNAGGRYFDEQADWYREAALRALQRIARKKPIFEINTGAMARGYRKTPYPADFLLCEINRQGCDLILSSDCHDRTQLDFAFREVLEKIDAVE